MDVSELRRIREGLLKSLIRIEAIADDLGYSNHLTCVEHVAESRELLRQLDLETDRIEYHAELRSEE